MSAANQLQQNQTNFYLDQWTSKIVNFTGYINGAVQVGNTFTAEFRYHQQGDIVMVHMVTATASAGSAADLNIFVSDANAIPTVCRPLTDRSGSVNTYNTATVRSNAAVTFNTDGTIRIYPNNALLFTAGVRINDSCETYFKTG